MRRLGLGIVALGILLGGPASAMASPTAADVLGDEAFGFCHDESYPLTESEARWCPVLPEPNPACPTFRAACDAPRAELQGEWGPLSERVVSEDGETKDTKPKEPRSRGPRDQEREVKGDDDPPIPSGSLGPLPQILVWIIVLGMLVAVVAQLRGPGVEVRRRRDQDPRRPPTKTPDPDAPARPGEPLPVDELLARAERNAAQGRLDDAVTDGHAALVRRLAERGRIHLHPSRTNGDHIRDLRDDPQLHPAVVAVVRLAERVQFGHAPPSRAEVDQMLTRVRSALGSLVGVLVLVFTALACSPTPTRDYPWSHSPSGMAGVLELLRGHGLSVEYRHDPLTSLSPGAAVPVVLDDAELTDEEWTALLHHVQRGGSAVLATRDPLPSALGIGYERRGGMKLRPTPDDIAPELSLVVPKPEGLIAPDGAQVLRHDDAGVAYALRLPHGDGTLLVLADGRLLGNAALAVADDGAWLVQTLSSTGQRFQLIDGGLRSLSGQGARDPFEAIERANLTPVVVQGLLLLLLLYLWRGVHFGRPRDPPPRSRRRFTEHVDALAQHYLRARARRHALRLYSGWALERIHERFGQTHGGLERLADRVAARTGGDPTQILRILVEAQHARDEDPELDPTGDADDLRIIRELGRILHATTTGQR